MLTLAYEEVDWLDQPHATNVENVNPFNVIVFQGAVALDPASDNWVRTIYIDDHRTESTGAKWKQEATVTKDVDKKQSMLLTKKVVVEVKEVLEHIPQQQLQLKQIIHQNLQVLLESLTMLRM